MKTIAELKAELLALQNERNEITAYLKEVKAKEARLIELNGSMWARSGGLIAEKLNEYRNAHYPIYEESPHHIKELKRVVYVDEKWIYTKQDYMGAEVEKYSVVTGLKAGTRKNSHYPQSIDAEKALELWANANPVELPEFFKPKESK